VTEAAEGIQRRCAELVELVQRLAASATMTSALAEGEAQVNSLDADLQRVVAELVTAQAKLDAMVEAAQRAQVAMALDKQRTLRLSIGPGDKPIDGWTNVDLAQGQVIADVRRSLPFPDSCASHIYCSHVLEHLRNPDEAHAFLCECRRVLRRGGRLRVVVPDIGEYLRASLEHDDAFWETHQQTWPWSRVKANRLDQTLRYAGAGPNPGDFFGHQHGYNAESLLEVLARAGFAPVRLSGFQQSTDLAFRIDDQSAVAHVHHNGRSLSVFVEGYSVF